MQIRPDVQRALDRGEAVVAFESTVISHGLPYPKNREVALLMEEAARQEGAVAATIGVVAGKIIIGLDSAQVEHLARTPGVRKCSRRELPLVVAGDLDAATTVSGTMYLAHCAGIRVFTTGGLGGVHRGHPFDVSADLEELSQTPMIVVCSGAKALLDLEATRERLETLGVPIIGYGTDQFPAFYSRQSGLSVDSRVETPEQVVAIARARDELGLPAAVVVAVPVPEEDELPAAEAERAIAQAVRRADEMDVRGAAVTPFLLAQITELTEGRSLTANLSLLANNARVAGCVARAWAANQRSR